MGVLLLVGSIRRSSADIFILRRCHIRRVICADPLILNFDSRYIGHPVSLSCRLALSNDQTLLHLPTWNENAVFIRLCRRSHATGTIRIINKLCSDFRFFNRAVLTMNLDRFRSACPRIGGNHIDIATLFCHRATFFQINIIICADHGIITKIEGSTYINAVTSCRKPRFLGQRVVVVLDNASCHGIGTTADATAYICNIVFNGTVGLFNRGCGP